MAGEIVLPEDLPEDVGQTSQSGQPVALEDLPPELVHKKFLAEQQGPPAIPTIAGAPPMPAGVNAVEEFLMGNSPYDPVKWLKDKLVAPKPTEPSVFGKTVDTSIQGLIDFLMPNSLSEGLLQAGTGYTAGKLGSSLASKVTKGLKAVRPLAKEVADEALGTALTTPEALQAKAFYEAADLSGKEIPIVTTQKVGKLTATSTNNMSFTQAQESIANLKSTAKQLQVDKQYHQAKLARDQADHITDEVEKTFPGFKATQQGYSRIKNIERIEELVGSANPLEKFELDIRKGRALGPEGLLLNKGGGQASRFLNNAERQDVLKILEDLGPKPGDHILRQMIEGRIVGGALGGTLGYQHSGAQGAAAGGIAGIMVPNSINWMISQGLRHPATRAFFKRSMEKKGGMASPVFWQTLGTIGERLGMNMFNPPPELPEMPPMPAPMPGMEGQVQQ